MCLDEMPVTFRVALCPCWGLGYKGGWQSKRKEEFFSLKKSLSHWSSVLESTLPLDFLLPDIKNFFLSQGLLLLAVKGKF